MGAEPGGEREHSLFIKKHFKASTFGGTYEDYTMVQPAFVVVDRNGLCNIVADGFCLKFCAVFSNLNLSKVDSCSHVKYHYRNGEVKQAWSWNTDELADVQPKDELKFVSAFGGATLVSVRP